MKGLVVLLLFLSAHAFTQLAHHQQKKSSLLIPERCLRSFQLWGTSSSASSEISERPNKGQKRRPKKQTEQQWRIFGIEVHPDDIVDIGPDELHPAVIKALHTRLKTKTQDLIQIKVVRRSLDARKTRRKQQQGPRFVYVMDVTVDSVTARHWKNQPGRLEQLEEVDHTQAHENVNAAALAMAENAPTVIIVGAGPAGLFCALELIKSGQARPIVLERGQPVEIRGKDIGALMHRRHMNTESNFAFGEGGAGTWSDGKLTTRIGRNSNTVRKVLETLVDYGAPKNILVEGAPHLGTDNLVRLLRNMRMDLRRLGGEIRFGTKVTGFQFDESNRIKSVEYETSQAPKHAEIDSICGDAVVLATGHSARDVYEQLHAAGVHLEAKGFAVGFRIEHPQKIINKIQYGTEWGPSVVTGKRPTDAVNEAYFAELPKPDDANAQSHHGKLPVPSYRLATDKAFDGTRCRGVYSFCMCPGGQIVPASTNPEEVCVNGMSFSRRDSQWANSALVVTVDADDEILEPYREKHGVLAGLAFQRDMERRASKMGGGNFTVPVQRVQDFIAQRPSSTAPSSSYRLSVRPAACHEIYPKPLMQSLRHALTDFFEPQMPGYVCEDALLHAVETRTSSPLRISRDRESMQAMGSSGLFPAGEGAGFAGGIVSAAVDGMVVAQAVLDWIAGREPGGKGSPEKSVGTFY